MIKSNRTKVIARLKKDLVEIAKEDLLVIEVKGAFYAFGSELACLRLFFKYNMVVRADKTRAGFSEPRQSFYFALDHTLEFEDEEDEA